MTGWRAVCSKRDEGCHWTIDSITEEDARTAGRLHYRTEHRSSTSVENKPILPSWPYRGRPNKTQLHLLRLAVDERLLGYYAKIYHVNGISEMWVPCSHKGQIQKWVPGLVDAGLLRNPKPQTTREQTRYRPYRVTPEGRRVTMQAETKRCRNAPHR